MFIVALAGVLLGGGETPMKNRIDTNTSILAPFFYAGAIRDAIRAAKFARDPRGLKIMAAQIRQKIAHLQFDTIVPIPTTAERLNARGFNLPDIIADEIKRDDTAIVHALARNNGQTQYGTDTHQRLANALTLFRVRGNEARRLTGKKTLIIDDVTATGATLLAAYNLLAPYTHILHCLAAARSPRAKH